MVKDYFGEVDDRISDGIMLDINRIIPYRQECDWTCSIACLRTIARTTKSGKSIIDQLGMKPGAYYSDFFYEKYKDDKRYDMLFGCNDTIDTVNGTTDWNKAKAKFTYLCILLREGYSVMVESIYNISHWMVLIGYLPKGTEFCDCEVLLWDPYLGKYRVENLEEFISMWYNGDNVNGVKGDYIAVRLHKVGGLSDEGNSEDSTT